MTDQMREARYMYDRAQMFASDSPEAASAIGMAQAASLLAIAEALQPAMISVEQLGGRVTDMAPRDAKHLSLDDPRYGDRCDHHWIISGDSQVHICFQAPHHDPADPHVCVCGLTRETT